MLTRFCKLHKKIKIVRWLSTTIKKSCQLINTHLSFHETVPLFIQFSASAYKHQKAIGKFEYEKHLAVQTCWIFSCNGHHLSLTAGGKRPQIRVARNSNFGNLERLQKFRESQLDIENVHVCISGS